MNYCKLSLVVILFVILFSSSFTFSLLPTADAKKAEGSSGYVPPKSYGSATKKIVCGDRLCSEVMVSSSAEPGILTSDEMCIENTTGLRVVKYLAAILSVIPDTAPYGTLGLFALNDLTCPDDKGNTDALKRVIVAGIDEILTEIQALPDVVGGQINLDTAVPGIKLVAINVVSNYQFNQCVSKLSDHELFTSLTDHNSPAYTLWDQRDFLDNVIHRLEDSDVQKVGIGNYAMAVNLYIAMQQQTALVDPNPNATKNPNNSSKANALRTQLISSINHTTPIIQELRKDVPLSKITYNTTTVYTPLSLYSDVTAYTVDYSSYTMNGDHYWYLIDCTDGTKFNNFDYCTELAQDSLNASLQVTNMAESYQDALGNMAPMLDPIKNLNATIASWQDLVGNEVIPNGVQNKKVCENYTKN